MEDKQIKTPGDVPRAEVPLPSRGKIYPADYPLNTANLIEGKYVGVRAMGIDDEDILSSEPLIRSEEAIDEFVKSALGGRVDVSIMCTADREAIMHAFRATGYGTDYNVTFECDKCEREFDYTFELSRTEIKTLDVDPAIPNSNLFDVPELPVSKAKLQVSIMTVGMSKEIDQYINSIKVKTKAKKLPMRSLPMKFQIQTINGSSDKSKIGQFVDKMSAADSLFVRRQINKIKPKVLTKRAVTCSFCGKTEERGLPLKVSYFFPEDDD